MTMEYDLDATVEVGGLVFIIFSMLGVILLFLRLMCLMSPHRCLRGFRGPNPMVVPSRTSI